MGSLGNSTCEWVDVVRDGASYGDTRIADLISTNGSHKYSQSAPGFPPSDPVERINLSVLEEPRTADGKTRQV